MSFKDIVSHDARRAVYVVLSYYVYHLPHAALSLCFRYIVHHEQKEQYMYTICSSFCLLGYVISIMLCDLGTL